MSTNAHTKAALLASLGQRNAQTRAPERAVPTSQSFNELAASVGNGLNTKLGFFKSRELKGFRDQEAMKFEEEKLRVATRLAIEYINNEAELIRTDWKREFAERYAVIAEQANAAQIDARMRLEALAARARHLTYEEVDKQVETLVAMLNMGRLAPEEAQEEVEYTKGRYKKLRDEFSGLCDEYTGNMSRPFKS